MENWVPICGYEGLYEISDLGRIRSLPKEWISYNNARRRHNGKILVPSYTKKGHTGYLKVILYKNGKRNVVKIHQLVARHFLSEPASSDLVLDHINGNKEDNRVCNLRWVTRFENSCCNNNTPTTPNKPVRQYDLNHNFIKEYVSISQAAKENNLDQGNITHCLTGRYNHTGGYIWEYS